MSPNRRFFSLSLGCATVLVAAALIFPPPQARAIAGEVVQPIDFTDQPNGDATKWLKKQGFESRLGARKLNPRFENGRLVLETDSEEAGVIAREFDLADVERIRLTWGVDRYPRGADWSQGVYRVPVAAMLSFGTEKIDSGSMVTPNAPYFISLFLGEREREGNAYTAQYFKKGGRYFCAPCSPPSGETVTTEFNLDKAFQEQFDLSPTPRITSIGFQMNTNDTDGGARAFLKSVEFLAP